MEIPFVHLHCHSHYSLLDGAGTITALLDRVKALEMPALALTDHGNLYGALEFYDTATSPDKHYDIKPIIGFEAYIAPGSRFERSAGSMKDASYHLTLLAMNRTGYQNLIRLSSAAFIEGFYYKPRIDKALLQECHEGLICLSGCASSEFAKAVYTGEQNDFEQAKAVARWYRELFGDRYYLELQDNGLEIQKVVFDGTVKIARELSIPTAATNDVHYVHQKDAEAQDILLCVNTKRQRSESNRMRMDSDQFFLRSGREMLQAMPGHEDAIRRTVEIADRVDCALDLKQRFFPVFTPPNDQKSIDYLRELCIKGLERRYADNPKRFKDGKLSEDVMARLDRELDVIDKKGYPNYFLIVWDFVRVAEERGIHRTARGSGVGALVCYALDISHVCPLEFDLLFERFLDESRAEPPDIDIDFDQDRREEILDYVKNKYGEEQVAQIGTFGTMAAKQSIKDVGRVLNMPIPYVNAVTALIPDKAKNIAEALNTNEELSKRYENEADLHELIDFARKLEGLNRQAGVHACAVVIADKPLVEYLPLAKDKDGNGIVTQWQGPDVEKAGLLKMDFLGLRNLSILAQAIELIRETTGEAVDPYKFPLDDKETYALLCRGETMGIFQLEGGGMRELLQRMKPDCFRDIIATLALYRPGPLEGGMVDQYVEVKHGKRAASYDHPVMEEVLAETNGVMVYQEQIMRILNRLGGIPLGESYSIIKAISKKKEKLIAASREEFVQGAQKSGLAKDKANDIFELIVKFAGYGFNKSHSTAYALVAYMTAYLKAHYPVEFMAALLCGDISKRNFKDRDSTVDHIEDCRRMGIEVIPPDVNISHPLYAVADGRIAFALTAVKGCGSSAAESITLARKSGGTFKDLFDFCERVDVKSCPRATIETLIKAGAFDSLGCHRSQLMRILDPAIKASQNAAEDLARGQKSLFSLFEDEEDAAATTKTAATQIGLPDVEEWPDKEKAVYEKEVLGFYLSAHPLREMEPAFREFRSHNCDEASRLAGDAQVIVAGMIGDIRIGMSKKADAKPYAMFTLEDSDGSIRSIAWPETYERCRELVKSESIVFATGRIDRSRSQNENDANLIVDDMFSVDEAARRLTSGIHITFDENRHSLANIKMLQEILRGYPGDGILELTVRLKNGAVAEFRQPNLTIDINPEVRRRVAELLGEESVKPIKLPPKKPKQKKFFKQRNE